MKSARPVLATTIEPLESRIAPAKILIGAQGVFENRNDTEYREAVDPNIVGQDSPREEGFNLLNFTDTSSSLDPISLAVHGGATNTFFLRLQAGDTVDRFSETGNYKTFITVKAGRAVAFFTDLNNNNEFDDGELTGISLGKGAVVEVFGSVNGDIASNLNEGGNRDAADDTVDMIGLVSSKQGINNLRILGGSVFGSIFSAGNITNLTLANNVESVLAGTAAHAQSFDFFTGSLGGKGIFNVAPSAGQAGASISNVLVKSITSQIQAGAGGAGGKGGAISNIQVTGDTDGLAIIAGAGGDGDAASRKNNGGAGGAVTNIIIAGLTDPSPNSSTAISVRGGIGGDGLSTGKGGSGGNVSKIQVGYEVAGSRVIESGAILADAVALFGGGGGAGKTGGNGGSVSEVKVRVRTPEVNGVEISVMAGDGGSSLSPTGKAGAGGSLRMLDLRNQSTTEGTDILVQAGRGGSTIGAGIGAAGGSISGVTALAFEHQFVAGNGSDGKNGGSGGSITGLTLLSDENVRAHNLLFDAGKGGDGSGGNGGNAGNITRIIADVVDLNSLIINSGVKGDGGSSVASATLPGKKGGKGGSVTSIAIADFDSDAVNEGTVVVRAGDGGSGEKGGGAGGSLGSIDFSATDLSFVLRSGAGGDATVKGKGGIGGAVLSSQVLTNGTVGGLPVTGSIIAGQGGDGKGNNGSGSAGGNINILRLSVTGDANVMAGNGGSGETTSPGVKGGAAGNGGSMTAVGIFATTGSASMQAGNGGALGAKPGHGGSIRGENVSRNSTIEPETIVGVRGSVNVSIIAGNGTHGGNGGDILGITYGSTAQVLLPTPNGDIKIQAGHGSAEGKFAGRGGSIDRLDGAVSSGEGRKTSITAGDGGGFGGGTKGGAGGSVRNVSISRGGAVGGELTIKAGDAGDSTGGSKGATGGSVLNVDVSDIEDGTIFRSVAAGDGGDALRKGGAGGSVQAIRVEAHDIGVRSGEVFGYSTMGGVFAGVGGAAGLGGKVGPNGNVIDISADAIASIVAGRTSVPQLVEKAAQIKVNGTFNTLLYNLNAIFPTTGSFRIQVGAQLTSPLPAGATVQEVQTALNSQIDSIKTAGGVTVTATRDLGYQIRWNQPGDRAEIIAIETVSGEITEQVRGSTLNTTTAEIKRGDVELPVVETRSGIETFTLAEINPGQQFLGSTEVVSADPLTGISETQLISTAFLAAFPTGTFNLSFEGETTPVALPANATALQIANALNGLATITAAGGVTVTDGGQPRTFLITFNLAVPQNPINGTFQVPETQRLDTSSFANIGGATYTISYNGLTSALIPVTANAGQIQAAIAPIVAPDTVTVSQFSPGIFNITFTQIGDKPDFIGEAQVPEIQTITLGNFVNESPAEFYLFYGVQRTSPLAPNATAAQIDAALEALPAIGAGGVSVLPAPGNSFVVTFSTNGQKFELVGLGKVQERQRLDLSGLQNSPTSEYALLPATFATVSEATRGVATNLPTNTTINGQIFPLIAITTNPGVGGAAGNPESQTVEIPATIYSQAGAEFYLEFNGLRTGFLPVTASAAAVQNALALIGALTTVNTNPASPGLFDITFVANGDVDQIDGNAGFRETQTLSLNPIVGQPGAQFTMSVLAGEVSIPLNVPATAAQIDGALDALPTLAQFGGVTVTQTSANNFLIRANDFGNFAQIVARGGGTTSREVQVLDLTPYAAQANAIFNITFGGDTTPQLPGTATAAEIQTALNALGSVQALTSNGTGAVTVIETTPDVFQITFNIFGNQPAFVSVLSKDDPLLPGLTPLYSQRITHNSSAAQIEAAIESVNFQGVTVTHTAIPGIFDIVYDQIGDQPTIQAFISTHEQQKIDVYAVGNFILKFDNSPDSPLLLAGASAAEVQAALLSINSILSLPLVNPALPPLTVTANADSSYTVVFNNVDGNVAFLGAEQFENFTVVTSQQGTATLSEVQTIKPIVKGEILSTAYSRASLVGAIVDINEIDSNIFKFIHMGVTYSAAQRAFQLGDTPIDGILMAKIFDQATANFTPEARLTAAGFFDHDNIIS